jgi:hypothetical protein
MEKETLKELFRVHFPNSKLIDNSYENEQGQHNLGICEHITKSGDWNLARHVMNQTKIKWALGTFKPFKSAGADGIVTILLKQRVEHVVPRLYHIFRACMTYRFNPTTWRQVKVTLIPSLGNSIILRLRLIELSASRLFF